MERENASFFSRLNGVEYYARVRTIYHQFDSLDFNIYFLE